MRILATVVFGVILCLATCQGEAQNRVLALLENLAIKETHSIYFRCKSLTSLTTDISMLLKSVGHPDLHFWYHHFSKGSDPVLHKN